MSKPTKDCKVVLWFDMKNGKWLGEADTMREMIKNGLTKKDGLKSGRELLVDLFNYVQKEKP